MDTARKHLLVRADFTLDRSRGGDRLTFKRWRRVLADALPRLMGLADCRAVLRLHHGEEEGRYSLWLRLPVERRPGRKRLGKIRAKLWERLESALLPVGGELAKLGVRRRQPRQALRLVHPDFPLQLAQADFYQTPSLPAL
jgi:hypothetical protein